MEGKDTEAVWVAFGWYSAERSVTLHSFDFTKIVCGQGYVERL